MSRTSHPFLHHAITGGVLAGLLALGAPLMAADDHAGHDHGVESHGADAHGPVESVGSLTVGTLTVEVHAAGAVSAGKPWHVELRLSPAEPQPKAVRAWIGSENGRGSVKAKATSAAPGDYDLHVEAPAPLSADAKLWIAIEPATGPAAKGSLALPAADAHAGHDHAGHGH